MFKNMKKLFALLLALTMLFALCAGCTPAGEDDEGSSDYMSLSPKEHLVALESAWLNNLKPNTNAGGGLPSTGVQMGTEVRIGQGLKDMLGDTAAAEILDCVNSVSIDSLIVMDGSMYQIGLGAGLNGTELADAEVVMDMANYVIWLSLPGLSDSNAKFDLGAMMEQAGGAVAMPTMPNPSDLSIDPELIIGLIKDYYTLVLNGIEDVEREEKALKCNGVEQEAIELTATVTAEDLANILLDVLKKAKDDSRIETLLDSLVDYMGDMMQDVGKIETDDLYEQLVDGIEAAIDSLENVTPSDDNEIVFKVYTDKKNNVIGREVKLSSKNETVGAFRFANVSDGEDFAVELSFEAGQTGFAFSGDGSIDGGKRDGEFALSMKNGGQSVDLVKFETEDVDDNGGKLKIEPTAELLNLIFGGAGYLDVALEVIWGGETVSFNVLMNDALLVGLDCTAKILDKATVTTPGNAIECDTPEEMTQWAQSIDIQELLDRLEEAGLPELNFSGSIG